MRLSQKLGWALQTPTAEGVCYEVDARLRPSGNQGFSSPLWASFERYHRRARAPTWRDLGAPGPAARAPGRGQRRPRRALRGAAPRVPDGAAARGRGRRDRADPPAHGDGARPGDRRSAQPEDRPRRAGGRGDGLPMAAAPARRRGTRSCSRPSRSPPAWQVWRRSGRSPSGTPPSWAKAGSSSPGSRAGCGSSRTARSPISSTTARTSTGGNHLL